jgi:hypothetical protein
VFLQIVQSLCNFSDMEDVLTEMVKAIKNTRTAPDQIDLPLFHPDGDDASSWLRKVEEVKDEFSWSDLQILVRVGRFLTGESKLWFDNNWSPTTRNWATFKREFLESFLRKRYSVNCCMRRRFVVVQILIRTVPMCIKNWQCSKI